MFNRLSVSVCLCLSRLSLSLSLSLSLYLYLYLPHSLSVYSSVYMSVSDSLSLSVILVVCLSVCLCLLCTQTCRYYPFRRVDSWTILLKHWTLSVLPVQRSPTESRALLPAEACVGIGWSTLIAFSALVWARNLLGGNWCNLIGSGLSGLVQVLVTFDLF